MAEFHGTRISAGRQEQSRLYRIWRQMKHRCSCPTSDGFKRYGAMGVMVCEAWSSFPSFRDWALAHGYAENLTLDRFPDVNGNYEPGNCRWATYQQQSENRRNTRLVEVNGEVKTVAAWSASTGIHMTTLHRRYHKGVRGPAFIAPNTPKRLRPAGATSA